MKDRLSFRQWVEFCKNVRIRNNRLSYRLVKGRNKREDIGIIGIIRLRNEALILEDTLDSISEHVDAVIVYDDASTDNSVEIARNHPLVREVLVNRRWRRGRVWEETANRRVLLNRARKTKPQWVFYFDADERFEGNIRTFLESEKSSGVAGVRISLFDAYMTPDDHDPFDGRRPLLGFRKYFGREMRDILMIWRNMPEVDYVLPDSREPTGIEGAIVTRFFCQHYGKALSIEQWEENCRYYYENFPAYSEKWKKRMGKSIHVRSDFGTELLSWSEVKKNPSKI